MITSIQRTLNPESREDLDPRARPYDRVGGHTKREPTRKHFIDENQPKKKRKK